MKNNTGLVEHAKDALNQEWGYVWGTFGQVLTESILEQKLQQYPSGVGNYESFIRNNWLNRRTCDCVGLIKSYIWWADGNPSYNSSTDVSADSMYEMAMEKGSLDMLPEIPGICLWKNGHIGVYIGNGKVIEARGTKIGVIESPLQGYGSADWTAWLKCPFIEYSDTITVKVNGKILSTDIVPINHYGHILVPARATFEALGYKVGWDDTTKTVEINNQH